MMALSTKNSNGPLGAEIRGADLSRDTDEQTFAAIRSTLDDRAVIVLRGQAAQSR